MKLWAVQDAKARFSELLDSCVSEGPQVVTRRGVEEAVLVPAAVWRLMQARARPSLKELLLADEPRAELDIPPRGGLRRRAPATFE